MITFHQIQLLILCCVSLRTMRRQSKMIIKGRSPTTRHVSRIHRVALDRLFDKINLNLKIQIRYIDIKHQLADLSTEKNFTRDECNNLLHLFNINHFSSTGCIKNCSLISCSKMTKRIQDQKKKERVLFKSRPATINFSFFIATSSSTRLSPRWISNQTHST